MRSRVVKNLQKRPIFLHAYATCSELPFHIKPVDPCLPTGEIVNFMLFSQKKRIDIEKMGIVS